MQFHNVLVQYVTYAVPLEATLHFRQPEEGFRRLTCRQLIWTTRRGMAFQRAASVGGYEEASVL